MQTFGATSGSGDVCEPTMRAHKTKRGELLLIHGQKLQEGREGRRREGGLIIGRSCFSWREAVSGSEGIRLVGYPALSSEIKISENLRLKSVDGIGS